MGSESCPEFDLDSPYRLSPDVALRPESFGALAYHFGTRKLSFLKTPRLVEIVRSLAEHTSARRAVEAEGVAESDRDSYLTALASLAESNMIVRS